MTPADVPTPDAIRPEWQDRAELALSVLSLGRVFGSPIYEPDLATMAEAVLAAVCGDIAEAARQPLLADLERLLTELDRLRSTIATYGAALGHIAGTDPTPALCALCISPYVDCPAHGSA